MNVVRIAISLFLLLLVVVSVTGWIWTGSHQPASQSIASRVVLTLGHPRRDCRAGESLATAQLIFEAIDRIRRVAAPNRAATVLIPPFGNQVEVLVVHVQGVDAARVGRICVKHATCRVLIEHADAFALRVSRILHGEVVERLTTPT
jgi:hypothetical protein